jgi:hypothetical protein
VCACVCVCRSGYVYPHASVCMCMCERSVVQKLGNAQRLPLQTDQQLDHDCQFQSFHASTCRLASLPDPRACVPPSSPRLHGAQWRRGRQHQVHSCESNARSHPQSASPATLSSTDAFPGTHRRQRRESLAQHRKDTAHEPRFVKIGPHVHLALIEFKGLELEIRCASGST